LTLNRCRRLCELNAHTPNHHTPINKQISFIQTDASFDSGVVGGPLVNEYGEVVGINSIGMTTSSTVQFSVPINQVKEAVTSLANGKVRESLA
jgi:S1-C subfamily serine protease